MRLPFGSERVLTHLAADASHRSGPAASPVSTRRCPLPVPNQRPAQRHAGAVLLPGDPEWEHLEALIRVAVAGEPDEVARNLTPDATGWSPAGAYRCRIDAIALVARSMAWLDVDDLHVTMLLWSAPIALAEWHLTASHREPMLIRDDLLVEPSGRTVALDGAAAIELSGERISSAHVYFDDARLIEQLLLPTR